MALPARGRGDQPVPRRPLGHWEDTIREMSELTDRMLRSWPAIIEGTEEAFAPLADLEETDDEYVLEIELPGVKKQDINIEVEGRRITVHGERKERERTGVLRKRTRVVGRFFHEIVLPAEIDEDQISASLDEGVLTVRVGKAAAERGGARKIEIG